MKQVSLFLCGLSRLHGDKLDFNPQMTQEELAIFLWDAQGYACEGPEGPVGCGGALQLTKNRLRIGDPAPCKK